MSSTCICSFFSLPKDLKTALSYILMILYDKHTLPMVPQVSVKITLRETTSRTAPTLFDQESLTFCAILVLADVATVSLFLSHYFPSSQSQATGEATGFAIDL